MLWKLAISVGYLCKSDANKGALIDAGLIDLLAEALSKTDLENLEALTRYSLESLWHLSFHENGRTKV